MLSLFALGLSIINTGLLVFYIFKFEQKTSNLLLKTNNLKTYLDKPKVLSPKEAVEIFKTIVTFAEEHVAKYEITDLGENLAKDIIPNPK